MHRYARPLIEVGFDVFTFDFRGHGPRAAHVDYRPLQWPSDKELDDVLGACAYIQNQLVSEGRSPRIGVFGISRGAGAALLAAASTPNIKAIVCDGAFSTRTTVAALMKRWACIFANVKLVYENHPDAFWYCMVWLMMRFAQRKLGRKFLSIRLALRNMKPTPILFIHGRRDSYIREDHARQLYAEAPGPRYLWIVEGAKHNQAVRVQPEQYALRTTAFFRRHLADENVYDPQIVAPIEAVVA